MKYYTASFIITVFLGGCVVNSDKYARPRDLSPSTLVDRTRLLGIQAEPPEIRPGESSQILSLLIDPSSEIGLTLWVACESAMATTFGCVLDISSLDFENATQEELEESGVIGVQPFFEPTYSAPMDALDHLEPEERGEGDYAIVQAFAFPEDIQTNDDFDFNEIESGFKRVVISEAETPNQNPTLSQWALDGIPLDPDDLVAVAPGSTHTFAVTLGEGAIEEYTYVNADNIVEIRKEEPYVNWYTSSGTIGSPVSLDPFLESAWTAPDTPGVTGTLWAVVRDRRGGLNWSSQPFSVNP